MRYTCSWRRLTWGILCGVFLAGGFFGADGQQKAVPISSLPLKERIAIYERPDREQWQKPDEVIRALGIQEGMVVADIGAGSGYFTRRFARAVGERGKVYAVDIDAEILEYLGETVRQQGVRNVEIVVGREDNSLLPEKGVDLVFFCDTTHHMRDRAGYFRHVRQILRPGGRMAIIDYPPEAHELGYCPHKPEELVPRWQIIEEAQRTGFELVGEFSFLHPRQYFLVFRVKPEGS